MSFGARNQLQLLMRHRNHLGVVPDESGIRFTLWAPDRTQADVDIEGLGTFRLDGLDGGYFSGVVAGANPGDRYWFRLDGGKRLPDLASRFQPDGNTGPSMIADRAFDWTDGDWSGIGGRDQVLYELHVGTFTPEGTWRAAAGRLRHLRDLGATVLQVMPVGTFQGSFGWGYDPTLIYAPFAPYGTPADMRAFVNAAHAEGIGVILDVVYNHVGIGDHFRAYGDNFLTDRQESEWGASFNFDGQGSEAVRDFIVGNAVYWIEDFHIDGLRIDAAQAMRDTSGEHIIAEITRAVRAAAAPRSAYVVVENQPQERRMVEPPTSGGFGLDAMISDDFQHAVRVAVTGHKEFYYRDYRGTPQELLSALKYGFLYQGQRSDMRDAAYGTDNLDTPTEHFVHFLENHDQVANSARGYRLGSLASPARVRAITSLLLLGPQTPCLFQGQEYGASTPFLYFSGLEGEDAIAVAEGRRKSLVNFQGVADPLMQAKLPDPSDPETFRACKLDWSEAEGRNSMLALHRDLLALRRDHAAFSQATSRRIDGAIIGETALLIRYLTTEPSEQRLLLVNLGKDLAMAVAAEPLLAPPRGHRWQSIWSSEHPDYDGAGRSAIDLQRFWTLPADSAVVFASEPVS